jgi:hypothetical protein
MTVGFFVSSLFPHFLPPPHTNNNKTLFSNFVESKICFYFVPTPNYGMKKIISRAKHFHSQNPMNLRGACLGFWDFPYLCHPLKLFDINPK